MARGDIYEATADGDLYYVDTGMYDTPEYGSVYMLDAERPALVDTGLGTSVELILDALTEIGIPPAELEIIAPTHVHLDHAGGAGHLLEHCPNADVYCYEAGARFLVDPTPLWKGTNAVIGPRIRHYIEPKPVPEDRLVSVSDGDTISLGDRTLEVYHAPGHAFHQTVFHDPTSNGVFVADAAGINTPTLEQVRYCSPPSDFSLEECLEDVSLLERLDPQVLYYGHFGEVETNGVLSTYRKRLTDWVERVERQRARREDDEAVIEYFVERTDTIDIWDEDHARGEEQLNVQGVLQYLDKREK